MQGKSDRNSRLPCLWHPTVFLNKVECSLFWLLLGVYQLQQAIQQTLLGTRPDSFTVSINPGGTVTQGSFKTSYSPSTVIRIRETLNLLIEDHNGHSQFSELLFSFIWTCTSSVRVLAGAQYSGPDQHPQRIFHISKAQLLKCVWSKFIFSISPVPHKPSLCQGECYPLNTCSITLFRSVLPTLWNPKSIQLGYFPCQ